MRGQRGSASAGVSEESLHPHLPTTDPLSADDGYLSRIMPCVPCSVE